MHLRAEVSGTNRGARVHVRARVLSPSKGIIAHGRGANHVGRKRPFRRGFVMGTPRL